MFFSRISDAEQRAAITGTDWDLDGRTSGDSSENVIVVVLTNRKEHASETPQAHVRDFVEEYREEHDFEFLSIRANQDAVLTATRSHPIVIRSGPLLTPDPTEQVELEMRCPHHAANLQPILLR